MGQLIGYKGTKNDRLESWLTLIALRAAIAHRPNDQYRKWYKKEFEEYLAA